MAGPSSQRRMMTIDGLKAVSMLHAGRLGALAYKDKVLSYSPIAYWMLAEAAGATAIDQVNSPAQDGTHVGVTLGQAGIGDGETCPLYDGVTNDYTNIWSPTFRDAFDGAEGTVLIWAKVSDVSVWTDGVSRKAVNLAYDTDTNRIEVFKHPLDNMLAVTYEAGNVPKWITQAGFSDIDWMVLAVTWSATADQAIPYKDGAQMGPTATSLGVWANQLSNIRTVIGDRITTGADPWKGWLAHCAVWDTALPGPSILDLSTL